VVQRQGDAVNLDLNQGYPARNLSNAFALLVSDICNTF